MNLNRSASDGSKKTRTSAEFGSFHSPDKTQDKRDKSSAFAQEVQDAIADNSNIGIQTNNELGTLGVEPCELPSFRQPKSRPITSSGPYRTKNINVVQQNQLASTEGKVEGLIPTATD